MKVHDFYGRSFATNPVTPTDLEVASGDVGPADIRPAVSWLALFGLLILLRVVYEAAKPGRR